MNASGKPIPVVATINIGLTPNGEVVANAEVPSTVVLLGMLEEAKVVLLSRIRDAMAKEKASLISHPNGFDPKSVPVQSGLRTG